MPALSPASLHFSMKAMFLPTTLIVCMPSRSCFTSSGVLPCTIFQYLEETIGICEIEKYLLIWSMVDVVPALLADVTAAAGFMKNDSLPLREPAMNRRSMNETRLPFADA